MLQIAETLLLSFPIGNRPHSSQKSTRKVDTMPFFKSIGRVIFGQARALPEDSAPQQNCGPTPANFEDSTELHHPTESPHSPAIILHSSKPFTPSAYTPGPAPDPTIPFNNGLLHPGSYIFTDLATTGTKGKGKTVLPLPPPRPDPAWPTCQSKNCPLKFAHEAGPYNFDLEGCSNGLPTPPDVILKAMLDTKLNYDLERNAALVIQFKLAHAWVDC